MIISYPGLSNAHAIFNAELDNLKGEIVVRI